MANWISVPNSTPVNFDQVKNFYALNKQLIFEMADGTEKRVNYPSIERAAEIQDIISSAVLNPTSGSPDMLSIDPTTISNAELENPTITGTNFRTTAAISLGGNAMATTFISSTSLLVIYDGSLAPGGPYNVVYSDDSGGSDTLVGALTITA